MLLSSYWPSCLILPRYFFLRFSSILCHSGSQQSTIVPCSKIQQLFIALHFGELIPPHWLPRLESVVQLVWHPSCATRFSFVTWGGRLKRLAFPTNDAKLMMQKINNWTPRLSWWTTLDWSHLQGKPTTKPEKEMGYTDVVFAKKNPMLKLERKWKVFREKLTWSDFWMNIYV